MMFRRPVSGSLISACVSLLVYRPLPTSNLYIIQSSQFRFPFIDLLGDGYSTFSYIPTLFISDNAIAVAGSEAYAETAIASTFDPPHDPYAFVPGDRSGSVYFDVFKLNSSGPAVLNTTFRPRRGRYGEIGEYPLSL